jgi:hypothetical protein
MSFRIMGMVHGPYVTELRQVFILTKRVNYSDDKMHENMYLSSRHNRVYFGDKMKMKSMILVILAAMALGAVSFADTSPTPTPTPAPTPDMGPFMKDMAKNLLPIVKNANDASQNIPSAKLVDLITADISQARAIMPPLVAALPADQQQGQMAQFQQMLDQLNSLFVQLKTDLLANANSAVATDLTNINSLKTDGHNKFKPQN